MKTPLPRTRVEMCKVCGKPMLLSDDHGKGQQFAKYHKACRKLRNKRGKIKKSLTKKKGNKKMPDEETVAAPEAAPESAPATEAPASEPAAE